MSTGVAATPRGARTKALLVASARDVFERDGFLGARIADISAGAGVGHGTFYTYFDSKESIFRETADAVVREMYGASQLSDTDWPADPVLRITEVNRRYLEAYRRNAGIMAIVDQVSTIDDDFRTFCRELRRAFIDRAARGIKRLQDEGLADCELDAATAASALGSMMEQFAHVWFVLGHPFEEDMAVLTVSRLWAQAIGLKVAERDGAG